MRVDMPKGASRPLIHPHPKTGMNALFSGPYAVVASLADGRIDLKKEALPTPRDQRCPGSQTQRASERQGVSNVYFP